MEAIAIADAITMIREREHRRQIETDFAIARDLRELLMVLESKYPTDYGEHANAEWELADGFSDLREGYVTTFYPFLRDGEKSRFFPSDSHVRLSVKDSVIHLTGKYKPTKAFKNPVEAALEVYDYQIREAQRKKVVELLKASTPASAASEP